MSQYNCSFGLVNSPNRVRQVKVGNSAVLDNCCNRTLHVFLGKPAQEPTSGVVLDRVGNLYGTTLSRGSGINCYGVVFEISSPEVT